MADQKEMKKRLKVLMNLPENQVCSDCNERQPRWASLIVPPPGAPEGHSKMGAFCCLECSGSHRRLGVHISFVRSVNLDSCKCDRLSMVTLESFLTISTTGKESEVQAMENGGNARVNAVFEARLAGSGSNKPTNHADGPTRERFIRDKYERRKFYDPAAFGNLPSPSASVSPTAASGPTLGTPSEAAQKRLEEKRRLKKASSAVAAPSPAEPQRKPLRRTSSTSSGRRKAVPKAPNSAPAPMIDLLDLTPDPAPSHNGSQGGGDFDLFGDFVESKDSSSPNSTGPSRGVGRTSSQGSVRRSGSGLSRTSSGRSSSRPKPAPASAGLDIMALYGTSSMQQQQPANNNNMSNMTSMMQNMNMNAGNGMMAGGHNNMTGGGGNSMMYMPQQPMNGMTQQQMMMQQYQQQQMMMYQQQMMQQQMMQQQQAAMGGYGAPMGSGPSMTQMQAQTSPKKPEKPPEKEDPFAQFAMNAAFR